MSEIKKGDWVKVKETSGYRDYSGLVGRVQMVEVEHGVAVVRFHGGQVDRFQFPALTKEHGIEDRDRVRTPDGREGIARVYEGDDDGFVGVEIPDADEGETAFIGLELEVLWKGSDYEYNIRSDKFGSERFVYTYWCDEITLMDTWKVDDLKDIPVEVVKRKKAGPVEPI